LLRNGVVFHELDHEQIRAACIGLSSVLLLPGLNTVIDQDHQWFWSWCAELLCRSGSSYFSSESDRELRATVGLCCRAALAGVYRNDRDGWERQRDQSKNMEHNARAWVQGAHTALAYLAFPLLEGIVKKHCARYVGMDGRVVEAFEVARIDGTARPYRVGQPCSSLRDMLWLLYDRVASEAARIDGRARPYRVGQPCSSLRDMLWLLYDRVASEELRHDLDEQRIHLGAFASESEDGFEVLYRWRNSSLHGEASLSTIGGTVLSTALLISISALQAEYESVRASAVDGVRREAMSAASGIDYRSPWSYYPPYF